VELDKQELVVEPAIVVGATTAGDREATSIGNLDAPLRRKHVRNPLFVRNNIYTVYTGRNRYE
jgi:hypothetical protein